MTFSEGEINAIMRDDQDVEIVLPRDYSDTIRPTLQHNYHNVKSSLIFAPGRYCNEIAIRIANLRPEEYAQNHDYYPSKFQQHPNFLRLLKSILITEFANSRTCVNINFSMSLVVLDDEDPFNTSGTFIWSSRGNFACLDSAYSIQSMSSLNHFVDNIVSGFSVEGWLTSKIEMMESKYSGIVVPITVNFYITLNSSTIFGAARDYTWRSLSDNNCDNSNMCGRNNCIWRAISAVVTINNENRPVLRSGARKRTNKKIAMRIKMQFLKWYKQNFGGDHFVEPVSRQGYDSRLLCVLEKYLKIGIVLVEQVKLVKKKVGFYGLKDTTKMARCLKVKFASKERSPNTIFLATDGHRHIRSVTNLPTFAYKYICQTCSKCYRYAHELRKHKCNVVRFRGGALQKWNYSLSTGVERAFGFDNLLKSDTKFMHVQINKEVGGSDISVKMCFSLLNNDYLVKTVIAPDLHCASQIVVENCTKAALLVLGERMKNNYSMLKMVENECNSVTAKSDPVAVENILNVKRGMVEFLSSFACYIQVGCEGGFSFADVMHCLLSTLSDRYECDSFGVRYGKNALQGITIKGSPVKYMSLGEFSPQFSECVTSDNHVVEWANTIDKFNHHFGLNITGLTVGQIGHQLMANSMSGVEKRQFLTSSVAFQKHTYNQNVRFGLLAFGNSSVVAPDCDYTSVISADFQRFYFSIITNPRMKLCVGIPVEYKENQKNGIFVPERTRRRKTLANVILKLIETVFGTSTVSLLHSRELSIDGKPVDGYFKIGGDAWVTEIEGCSHHGLKRATDTTPDPDQATVMHNQVCHLPKKVIEMDYPGHIQTCDVCVANCSREYSFVRPKLWRLRDHETVDSPHFNDKTRSYAEIYEATRQKITNLQECGLNVMVIWECTILRYWSCSVKEFFAQWKLTVNEQYENEALGKVMAEICTSTFPLSKYPYLTEKQVVECIKDDKLNGYAVVSCNFGLQSRHLLSPVKPFFFKNESGDACQSYAIEKKCVPTCLLRELLNNASFKDFSITKVYHVFEYASARENPFTRLREPVLNALKEEGSSLFSSILKIGLNVQIGCLNFNPKNRKKSMLINESDIAHLNSPSTLSHCTRLNDTKVLLHLRDDRPVSNLSHLHLSIIATGVAVMLDFIVGVKRFFGDRQCVIQRVNTDGITLKMESGHLPECFREFKRLSIAFDGFLVRTDSSPQFLRNYVKWKKDFFKNLGFCELHEELYINCLASDTECFSPGECCTSYINTNAKYQLVIEFVGDIGIFKSVNSFFIGNTVDKTVFVKGSGFKHLCIDDVCNKSGKELLLLM